MRNLIVTLAATYGARELEPFLASWRRHARGSELLIFTADCQPSLHQACARLGVQTVALSGAWRYSLLTDRHFVIRDYLRENANRYDAVLITDSRDVIFQGDPFAVPRDREVWFAAEDQEIMKCDFNHYWMAGVYGVPVVHELAAETICCAGTTIGGSAGVLRYLELMCAEAERLSDKFKLLGDQASHNYIYYKLKPDFIGLDREDRVVQTLSHTDPGRVQVRGGRIRVDGRVAPVLHQWDRHPQVFAHVARRYRLPEARAGSPGRWRLPWPDMRVRPASGAGRVG